MTTATLIPRTNKPPTDDNRPYLPWGGTRELMSARDNEVLIEGPAGTGKSRAVLEKVHAICERYPGARVLLVRKSRASMTESVLVTWESLVVPVGHPCLNGAGRAFRQAYSYPNGSEVIIGGMDKASRIMSTEYDIVCMAEATECTEDDFETLSTRLRNGKVPYQQMIADCNPSGPNHWLNKRAASSRMRRILSRHTDNPALFGRDGQPTTQGAAYLARLEALTGVRRRRLLEGHWAAAEGMVYGDWDAAVHVVDPFEIPADWRRIRSIDFGYTNAFVCQWWALDGDDRMFLYRELYRTQSLVEDLAGEIISLTGAERIEASISDHDAEDRATLERHGIVTIPAVKSVRPGIEAVEARLRRNGDGKPRLYVVRDALVRPDPKLVEAHKPTCTLEEVEGYQYPTVREGKAEKEEPVKVDDHGMDALRYAVAYVDGVGTQRLEVIDLGAGPKFHAKHDDERCWKEAI